MAMVHVRIAVAVAPSGAWNACGFSSAESDADMMDLCIETLDSGEARYWLEAYLEVPSAPVVQATVTAA